MLFVNIIQQLKEERNLLQRNLAASLDMDAPMFSKIERDERFTKRAKVTAFAKIPNISKNKTINV